MDNKYTVAFCINALLRTAPADRLDMVTEMSHCLTFSQCDLVEREVRVIEREI